MSIERDLSHPRFVEYLESSERLALRPLRPEGGYAQLAACAHAARAAVLETVNTLMSALSASTGEGVGR